ncbi:MAG TPA: metallophosphatase, partial [Bacteroidales bacterium]|nr:metallophosphatase [Bacteroidales bacterium]
MYRFLTIFILLTNTFLAQSQSGKKITIFFTNDLHSRVTGYAPESAYSPLSANNDSTSGGFARIASIIKSEKSSTDDIVFTADAGDFLMGTLFQSLETTTGFQLQLMKKMGYDVVAIGNHEFDYGPGKLSEIIASASEGEIPAILLSNAAFSKKDTADDRLANLFDDNVIGRKYIIERGGIRAGFFSLLGKVADDNAAFAPPVTFDSQVATARRMVKELTEEKCDLIICLSHSGVIAESDGKWGGEDVELAAKVKGIDVIISGHTHTILDKPVIVNSVPVVQTGEYGRYVGKLSFTLNDGKVKVENYELVPVDDKITGDKAINDLIEQQKKL